MKRRGVMAFVAGLVILMTALIWATAVLASDVSGQVQENWASLFEQKVDMNGVASLPASVYTKDVEHLANLHLLTVEKIDWTKPATWNEFLAILTNLNNRKAGVVPGLDNWLPVDGLAVTYAEALKVLLPVLAYPVSSDQANVNLAQELGIGVEKGNIYDNLSGEEMAHLIYRTLQATPQAKIHKDKNLLEEVFLIQAIQMPQRKILKVTSNTIEVEYDGTFNMASTVTVFDANTSEPLSMSDVVVGMTGAYLVLDDYNVVQSIGIVQKYVPSTVRVLLSSSLSSTGGSNSYDFADARITANQTVYVRTKDTAGVHNLATVPGGTQITLTCSANNVYYNGTLAGPRVYIESDISNVQLTLLSTTRGGANPIYDGKFEVIPSSTANQLYVINELPMENYLYKVVPSEMPASWHVEALKCQAVAARSYAAGEIYGGGLKAKSANVDDSTNYQVYNNSATTAAVKSAVDATKGQVMTYNGEVITAYFSSTSSGYTANNDEVWHNSATGAFPGVPLAYVRAKPQILNYTYPNFADEVATLAYFKNTAFTSTTAFDYSAAWFRWNVNLTRAELEATISKNLPLRESADQTTGTDFIQTISGAYPTPGNTTFSIGTLLDLRVMQRGQGGNIMILEIVGSNGTWRVLKEYNVRMVLRPNRTDTSSTRDIIINCHNGTRYTNYSLLPSAFASFEIHQARKGTGISDVTIYGGGNGHGVGMSQYGAKGYAEAGYLYQDILNHFYTNVVYTVLY